MSRKWYYLAKRTTARIRRLPGVWCERGAEAYNRTMRFRSATNADTADIRRVASTVLLEYGLEIDCGGVDTDLDDVEAAYIETGGVFEVIETDEGRIVGTGGMVPKGDGVAELRKMYLLREARGKGLGKTMLDRLIRKAKSAGFHRVELETTGVLTEAAGLYKRYGFRPIHREPAASRCDQALALDLRKSAAQLSKTAR